MVAARQLDGRPPPRGPSAPTGPGSTTPGRPGTIETVRFSDLLAGRVPPARLRGKVAVVGVTDPNAKDVYATPGSGAEVMAGAEVQAHALDTIRRDFPLRELPGGAAALFAALFGLAMPVAALRVRRWPWLALVAVVALGPIAYLAFLAGLIVPVAAPLAALVVGTLATLAVDLATGLRARERMRGAFARFVPAQIVDDVIERTGDDYRLTGDRLEATVLFCDLRGFTSLAESLDAERVIEVLDRYLTEMSDAILDQDGTVVSYMGDGIMAVFGAPIADDEHAAQGAGGGARDDRPAAGGVQRLAGRRGRRGRTRCAWASAWPAARSCRAAWARTGGWSTPPSATPPTWPRGWRPPPRTPRTTCWCRRPPATWRARTCRPRAR